FSLVEICFYFVYSFSAATEEELRKLLSKQNQSGEMPMYVVAECGHVDIVKELIEHCDTGLAGIKARNGYDAFHIASKQGNLETLRVLMEANPELAMTFDSSNTTALHSAAAQGHMDVVDFLLERCGTVAAIAKSNGKTALHSATRNGHLQIVKALLGKDLAIATRTDKKGQMTLHMAVKGQNAELVEELVMSDPSLINMIAGLEKCWPRDVLRPGRAATTFICLLCSEILPHHSAAPFTALAAAFVPSTVFFVL
ncbi:unnamed protein product, partial [Linum tenue]